MNRKNVHMLINETFRNMTDLLNETCCITDNITSEEVHRGKNCFESHVTIDGVKYRNCLFEPNIYRDITFNNCVFEHCMFRGCDSQWHVLGTDLVGLKDITFFNCSFVQCDFGYGESLLIENTHFNTCITSQCRLNCIRMNHCIGEDCTFHQDQITVRNAFDVHGIDFSKSRFKECSIRVSRNAETYLLKNNDIKMPYIPTACPEKGEFIAWKVAIKYTNMKYCSGLEYPVIIKLRIPEKALRSSAPGSRKCRASEAEVLSIETLNGSHKFRKGTKAFSYHNSGFIYTVGETVKSRPCFGGEEYFDECRYKECAEGIHFFMNRDEAIDYGLEQGIIGSVKK